MPTRRVFAFILSALLSLLSPGPAAWAALARTTAAARPAPAGSVRAVPVRADAGPLGLFPALTQPSLGRTPLPELRSFAAPRLQPAAAAPILQPSAEIPFAEKIGVLAAEAAPGLAAAQDRQAASEGLRGGAEELQLVLEGLRPAAADSSGFAPASNGSAAGLTAAAPAEASSRPAPPAPEPSPEQKSRFRYYAAAVSGVKVGIEALNLAVPILLLSQFHAALAVGTLYIAAEAAGVVAGWIGGTLVDRVGANASLVLSGLVQAAAIAGVPLALTWGGAFALPLVYALFTLNGAVSEIFDVARRSALPEIVGSDEGLLRKYNGRLYVFREVSATAGVFAAGWLVHQIGALATIWAHPAFCLAAALAALRLLRGPRANPALARPNPRANPDVGLAGWWAGIASGARRVFSDRKLRAIALVNVPMSILHKLFHALVAVVYATQVLHNPAWAAVMLGAWNIGELAGASYLERRGPATRLANWLRLGGVVSLSMWIFWLLPSPWAAAAASFALAAALIGNELGVASYMQANVPQKELGAVTGFVYGLGRAAGMAALMGAGLAFDALGAAGGMLVLAAAATAFAPIYWLVSRRFKGEKIDPPADHDD
ncbi:MAG: MFS transporter [Elusimicrobia bacterium]|nr:MFS transporter [Elusimicrobiota bacterium]